MDINRSLCGAINYLSVDYGKNAFYFKFQKYNNIYFLQ